MTVESGSDAAGADRTGVFVAYDEGEAIGAARLRPVENGERSSSPTSTGKVERVAVVADRRGED
jgi:predicted N-acetyltransferase YhbS